MLALAGLTRLGITAPHSARLGMDVMVPAPGQGALALQARADDLATLAALGTARSRREPDRARGRALVDVADSAAAARSRSARIATVDGGRIEMLAVVIAPDGSRVARVEVVSDSPEGAAALATKELIAEGAEEILEALDDDR